MAAAASAAEAAASAVNGAVRDTARMGGLSTTRLPSEPMIDGTGCLIIRDRGARGQRAGLLLPVDDEGEAAVVLYEMGCGVFGVAGIAGT